MIFYKPEYIHVNMNNKVITLNTVNRYHQWMRSSRWKRVGQWWCTETPAIKISEVQASPQDKEAVL